MVDTWASAYDGLPSGQRVIQEMTYDELCSEGFIMITPEATVDAWHGAIQRRCDAMKKGWDVFSWEWGKNITIFWGINIHKPSISGYLPFG